MTLAQLFNSCNTASYFSRGQAEIYAAISRGVWMVYSAVLKEFQGTFLKWDTTSLTLTPGQDIYSLPADFSQLVQLSERASASLPWSIMTPLDLNSRYFTDAQFLSGLYSYAAGLGEGPRSIFSYAGPYMDGAAAAAGTETWKIKVAPVPVDTRPMQIAYIAAFVPVTNAASPMMIPAEGAYAVEGFAIAELMRRNSDALAQQYETRAQQDLTAFLTWMRARQVQEPPTQAPYLDDLD